MNASEYAAIVTVHGIRRDPTVFERLAVAEVPQYAARVEEIAAEVEGRIAGVRPAMLQELGEEDSDAVDALTVTFGRRVLRAAAVFAAAGAFAFYFSRADVPTEISAPGAAILIALAAVLYGAALLRAGTDPGPDGRDVLLGGALAVLAVLSTAMLFVEANILGRSWGWAVAAASATVVVLALWGFAAARRSRTPRARRTETLRRLQGFQPRLAEGIRAHASAALLDVRQTWDALDPEERYRLRSAFDAARAVLDTRGLSYALPATRPEPLGAGIVLRRAGFVAARFGVHDVATTVERPQP